MHGGAADAATTPRVDPTVKRPLGQGESDAVGPSRPGPEGAVSDGGGGDDDRDDPLAELAARVAERRDRDASGASEGPFAEPGFDALESDSVWDSVEGATVDDDAEVVSEGDATYVVDKAAFCESCPHLSHPPRVRCTHPGTTIHEFVDKDHVRVSACPVVEERGVPDDG